MSEDQPKPDPDVKRHLEEIEKENPMLPSLNFESLVRNFIENEGLTEKAAKKAARKFLRDFREGVKKAAKEKGN